jgi:hypothetical protein
LAVGPIESGDIQEDKHRMSFLAGRRGDAITHTMQIS